MPKLFFLLFILLAFFGAGCFRPSANPTIGSSHFGRLVGGPVTESDIKNGWVRPHPGPFLWDQIETSQDVYDWSEADRIVKYWQERNQAILATLWPFAQWDQQRCHAKEPKVKHPFSDEQVWLMSICHVESYEEWVRNVVERYDGDGIDDMPGLKYPITHWEIGNEPDLQTDALTFFQYSPLAYAEIYRIAYEVIKQTDPNATVLFGGMSSMNPNAEKFWENVLRTERSKAEVFNIHSIGASDQFYSKEYHEFLDRMGVTEKPFWITEALVGSPFFKWDEQKAAQMTLIGYVQAFANGAEKIFNVGMRDPNGGPGEASEKTFELVVKTIDGFEKAQWISQESIVKFTIGKKIVYALWDGALLPEDVKGKVDMIRYDGRKERLNARDVKADEPMFVIVR
jgi:hypothetical protein